MDGLITKRSPDNSKSYRIYTLEETGSLKILILEGHNSYSCQVSESQMAKFAEKFQTDVMSYKSNLLNILSTEANGYVVITNELLTVFNSAKKEYLSANIRQTHFNDTTQIMLDDISMRSMELHDEIIKLNDKRINVKKELENCKSEMKSLVTNNKQKTIETYSRFIQLIKEKDRRIQFLTDIIESGDIVAPTNKRKKTKRMEVVSESEDSTDVDQSNVSDSEDKVVSPKKVLKTSYDKDNESQIDLSLVANYSTQDLIDDI